MKRLLMIVLVALGMTSSAAFASTTLTINVTGMSGGTAPGSSIRIDLQNCADAHVLGTGQVVPQTQTIFPVAGIAIVTLFSNTDGAGGGQILCQTPTGQQAVSYYSFSYIFQGVITSVGSYNLIPGTFNLADLTPCVGAACIGSGSGGVTRIIAGNNITISPTNGLGAVTINSSGGGGGAGNPAAPGGSLQGGNAVNDSFESANIFLPSQFCSPLGCTTPNGLANLFAANGISAITDPTDNFDPTLVPTGNNNLNLRLTLDGLAGFSSINTLPTNRNTQGDAFPSQFLFEYNSTIPGGNGGVGVSALGFVANSNGFGNNTANPDGTFNNFQNDGFTGSNGFVGACNYARIGLNGCTQFGINSFAQGDLNVLHYTINYQSGLGAATSSEGVNAFEINALQYPSATATIATGSTGSRTPTVTLTSGQFSTGGAIANTSAAGVVTGTLVSSSASDVTTSITSTSIVGSGGSGQTGCLAPAGCIVAGIGGGGTGATALIIVGGDGKCDESFVLTPGVNYTGDTTFTPPSGGTPCSVTGLRTDYLHTMTVAGGALTPSTGFGIVAGVWGDTTSCAVDGSNNVTILSQNTLDAGETQTVTFGTMTGGCAFLTGLSGQVSSNTIHQITLTGITHSTLSPTTTTGKWQSPSPVPAAALNGDITACAVANNILTVTATNAIPLGNQVSFAGFAGPCAFLNTAGVLFVKAPGSTSFTAALPIPHANLSTASDAGFYNAPVNGIYQPQNIVLNLQNHLAVTTGKCWYFSESTPETCNITSAPAAASDVQFLTVQTMYTHKNFSDLFQGGTNGCLHFSSDAKPLPPSGTPWNATDYGMGIDTCYYAPYSVDSTHFKYGYRVQGRMNDKLLPATGSETESFTAPANGYSVIPMAPVLGVDANHQPLLAFNDLPMTAGDTVLWLPDPTLNFHGPSWFLGANQPSNSNGGTGFAMNLFGMYWTGATTPFSIQLSNPADWYIGHGGVLNVPNVMTIGGTHKITLDLQSVPDESFLSVHDNPSSPVWTLVSDCSTCAGNINANAATKTWSFGNNVVIGATLTTGGDFFTQNESAAGIVTSGQGFTVKGFDNSGISLFNSGEGYGRFGYGSTVPVTPQDGSAILSAGTFGAGTLQAGAVVSSAGSIVLPQGTTGATSSCYDVEGVTANGSTGPNSLHICSTTSNATLSGTNFNLVNFPGFGVGVITARVYRSTNGQGLPTGLLTSCSGITATVHFCDDIGQGVGAALPGSDTSGSLVINGTCTLNGASCFSGSSFITSLTTTGSSGPATVVSGVLNIPQYTGGGGISGLTTGQVGIAGSATTLTSSIPIAGAGPGLTSGPNSGVTPGDVALFTGTGGQITDGAIAGSNIMTLSGTQTVTGAKTFSSTVTVTGGSGIQLSVGAFSTLPTCNSGTEGTTAGVNDSTTNTWGATITGSGSDHVMAYCDGSAWTVVGK